MVWDDVDAPQAVGRDEPIELVGTHLRLTGIVSLGRFNRLTDMVNASPATSGSAMRGCFAGTASRRRSSSPEIMVDQDEISFIAQREVQAPEPGTGAVRSPASASRASSATARRVRHVHAGPYPDAAGSTSSDRRTWRPSSTRPTRASCRSTEVSTRSLADRRIVSHYPFVLINRTQMIAAAEAGGADERTSRTRSPTRRVPAEAVGEQ